MSEKSTTEEFIRKAKEVHGDKYDYSKVEYVNAITKVCVICPEHGEFFATPNSLLSGHGCQKCFGRGFSTREIVEQFRNIHGDKYDYSKVKYVDGKTKVCIICPEHGEFWQKPTYHLRGQGCPQCAHRSYKYTTSEFTEKAREVHGDKYDYSKVKYVDGKTKVCIICPEHGEFWQLPNNHLKGSNCPKCANEKTSERLGSTTEEFIKKARKVHGDKYNYSKVEYVDAKTKVCIICPVHGEFWQTPNSHLRGRGCAKCSNRIKRTTEDFIQKARKVHGDKYDYSKAKYVNQSTKVCIICPEHGEFWQNPANHLKGHGCSKCNGGTYLNTEVFIKKAREVHGDKYDYSKVEYTDTNTKVCIICPEHGEFWQKPTKHLSGKGCPICNLGYTKEYKFNLLQEFESEYDFRAFLANNDVNILYVILRNIEPKFDPIKRDIERALAHSNEVDPMKALSDKYTSDSEDELDEDEEEVEDEAEDFEIATAPSIDLDDDDAIDTMVATEATNEADVPTIEDVIKNTEREIKVINKIEHMLTPEDREYIMNKFLNDKRRIWMAARENRK